MENMKKWIILLLGIGLLVFSIGITVLYLKFDSPRKMTFEECTAAGGAAWRVDLYHPDICPSCAEYQACEEENRGASDIRDTCPQVVACSECLEVNFPNPGRCPDGRDKIGEISDAAIWFQCCR